MGDEDSSKRGQSPDTFLENCIWALIDAREDEQLSDLLHKVSPEILISAYSWDGDHATVMPHSALSSDFGGHHVHFR